MSQSGRQRFGLIVVAAPSGAGKSTLCTHLLRDLSDRLSLSVSCTSRRPRGSELHGKEYLFLTEEDFKTRINAGEFAEWANVHGNYYGTSKKTIESFWSDQKHVLLDIDIQGSDSLRAVYPDQCFTVFIAPPDLEELERRLRARGTETEEAITKRMRNAVEELKHMDRFDLVLINDSYEETYRKLRSAIVDFMNKMQGSN